MNTISDAIGQKIEWLIMWLFTISQGELQLLPDRFERWLTQHKFRTSKQIPGQPRTFQMEVDYQKFAQWVRNSILAVAGWASLFGLYAIVLGHASVNAHVFGIAITIGVILFFVLWMWLLIYTVLRISGSLFTMALVATLLFAGIFVGGPLLQLYNTAQIPHDDFWLKPELYSPILLSIARGWVVLGFALSCLLIAPILWTASLGPAILALATQSTKEGFHKVAALINKLFDRDTPEAERNALLEELRKKASATTSTLESILFVLALFSIGLFLYPTTAGLMMAVTIGMLAIVTIHIRKAGKFRGRTFRKILFGITCGFLIFVAAYYGIMLIWAGCISTWKLGLQYFVPFIAAIVAALFGAVYIAATSTTQDEQLERRQGDFDIKDAKLEFVGFNQEGKPVFGKVEKDGSMVSTTTLKKITKAGRGRKILMLFLLICILDPLAVVLANFAFGWDLWYLFRTYGLFSIFSNPDLPIHAQHILGGVWLVLAISATLIIVLLYEQTFKDEKEETVHVEHH